MKYLVTGGAGFIGSNIALALEKEGDEVTVIDNFSTGIKYNLKNFKGKTLNIDISKPFTLSEKFDAIFHEAAITDPRFSDDTETLRQNIVSFDNILKIAIDTKAKLIYASSASLYGNGHSPQKENQKKDLQSAYAKSKLMIDSLAENYFDKMHIVGLRYFNVFGPGEEHKGRPSSMIYHLAKQMKEGHRPKIFEFGEQKRDHIYVKDCVTANLSALTSKSGIYNVGTGVGEDFNMLVKTLNEVLKKDLKPEYIKNPYGKNYQVDTCADTTKAEKELKFKAKYSLKEGIADYMKVIRL